MKKNKKKKNNNNNNNNNNKSITNVEKSNIWDFDPEEDNIIDVDVEEGDAIDTEDNVYDVEEASRFKKTFASRNEANETLDVLDALGYEDNYETSDGGKSVILYNLTEKDVAVIQRKVNISKWSKKTTAVANAVTDFATDVADYALNGALAPTTGAVINAAMTTGRVVATAGVTIVAATAATTIRNGRKAVSELRRNKDVEDAWNEVKGLGSDIGGFLFGSESSNSTKNGKKSSSSSWTAC